MQAVYTVIIRRYSWDDSRNSPAVHHYDYRPRQVDLETYNNLTSNTAVGLGAVDGRLVRERTEALQAPRPEAMGHSTDRPPKSVGPTATTTLPSIGSRTTR